MNERIKQLRKELELNQTEFGAKIGLSQTAIHLIEKGTTQLTSKQIKPICSIFGVNEDWILTGEGEMFRDNTLLNLIDATVAELTPQNQKYLLSLAETMLADQSPNTSTDHDPSDT